MSSTEKPKRVQKLPSQRLPSEYKKTAQLIPLHGEEVYKVARRGFPIDIMRKKMK